jgi:hypothetical protein
MQMRKSHQIPSRYPSEPLCKSDSCTSLATGFYRSNSILFEANASTHAKIFMPPWRSTFELALRRPLTKLAGFVERFGPTEVFLKPLRLAFAPLIIPFIHKRTLIWQNTNLQYFYHRYNMTWANERCIEVPIAKWYLEGYPGRRVLEIGNVLSHYFPITHDVVDKFEHGPGVINQDIVEFKAKKQYDLIISISTFEHIGFDDGDHVPSDMKIRAAVSTCLSLLRRDGKLVVTVPLGYNPDLDGIIRTDGLGAAREFYFRRKQARRWESCDKAEALTCRYGKPFPYANALLVAEIAK